LFSTISNRYKYIRTDGEWGVTMSLLPHKIFGFLKITFFLGSSNHLVLCCALLAQ